MDSGDLRYQASVNLAERNNSHTLAFELVQQHAAGRSLHVLDVGCASGYWGAVVRQHGHLVVGVEPDPAAASRASELLESVHCGDLNSYFAAYPMSNFDVVSFVDVLEHIPNPGIVLAAAMKRLTPGGVIIASIPNVAHLAVRAMLLEGRWEYARTGILDDSHLRFLCKQSIVSLFSSVGLRIERIESTNMRCRALSDRYGLKTSAFARFLAWLVATDCRWRDFQYVVAASVPFEGGPTAILNARHLESPNFAKAWLLKLRYLQEEFVLALKIGIRKVVPK